jgi:hypothetical protein
MQRLPDVVPDIGPKFPAKVAGGGESYPDDAPAKLSPCVDPFGPPRLRDKGRREIGHQQAVSRHGSAALVPYYEGPANGISHAPPAARLRRAEISGILVVERAYRKCDFLPYSDPPQPGRGTHCIALGPTTPTRRSAPWMIEGCSRGDHEKLARPEDLIKGPGVVLPQGERNVGGICVTGVIGEYRGNLLRDKILFGDLYILRR